MSMFMAAMAQELRETGELRGLSGMSSAAWKDAVREYEQRREEDRQQPVAIPTNQGDHHG